MFGHDNTLNDRSPPPLLSWFTPTICTSLVVRIYQGFRSLGQLTSSNAMFLRTLVLVTDEPAEYHVLACVSRKLTSRRCEEYIFLTFPLS